MQNEHQLRTHYDQGFASFLAHTDEKEMLRKAIGAIVRATSARSLLDIGAGGGDLAIPLARKVASYVAVEHKRSYADHLTNHGIEVIAAPFPCDMSGRVFDVVLASHSLPFQPREYQPFITAMWDCVREGGDMVLITYNNVRSTWTTFKQKLGLPIRSPSDRLQTLQCWLEQLGPTTVDIIETHVQTTSAADMFEALAFVYSDCRPEKVERFSACKQEAERILKRQYWNDGFFTFPFEHHMFCVHKQ